MQQVEGLWDLIMFHHSLEHMPDPHRALREARERLSASGRIVVRVPTVSSFAFREYLENWPQIDVPRHYFVPSSTGLARLFAATGFEPVETYRDATDFQFWGPVRSA